MLKDKKLLLLFSVSILLILLIGIVRPREIDWTPTFSAMDKIPYGNYVLYHQLGDIAGKQPVNINRLSVYSLLHDSSFYNSSLIFIQNEFNPSEYDTRELLEYVADSNSVFISSLDFGSTFADTLRLRTKADIDYSLAGKNMPEDTTEGYGMNFTNPHLRAAKNYNYRGGYYQMYFNLQDSDFLHIDGTGDSLIGDATVLGVNGRQHPMFIRLRYGKGYIYLHNYPYAFCNYYMLKPNTAEYAAKCLSYLPTGQVIWDEYYKGGSSYGYTTPLGFILSKQALRWAYYLSLFSLLLYIAFNVKRRQRAIPIVEPYKNTTLEFVRTVGDLYYNEKDHKNIARKKISYFLEFIRNRYGISTQELGDEFVQKLAYKSGLEKDRILHLFNVANSLQTKEWISDTELIDLNNNIEYFKHHCQ